MSVVGLRGRLSTSSAASTITLSLILLFIPLSSFSSLVNVDDDASGLPAPDEGIDMDAKDLESFEIGESVDDSEEE